MTPQEKYAAAFKELLKAKKEVIESNENPFSLTMPTHEGLPEESFISNAELEDMIIKVGSAAEDNRKFSRLWHIGTDIVVNAKALI